MPPRAAFLCSVQYYIGLTNLQKNISQGLDIKTTNRDI